MKTTPSTKFSKMNLLNFHYNHCSKLSKNTFEIILIGDSIVPGLSRYQNVWDKFLKPLKALNCGLFRSNGIHLIHLNVYCLLQKIDEIRYKAERTKAAVIGITESKLGESIFQLEIQIENYNSLRCD